MLYLIAGYLLFWAYMNERHIGPYGERKHGNTYSSKQKKRK